MTADDLRNVHAEYERAAALAAVLLGRRNHRFREARAEGWTLEQIAEATGLTKQRVSQIGSAK